MSEELHSTNAPTGQKPLDNWFAEAVKKQTVAIFCGAVFLLYQFFWNSHDSQKDLNYQVTSNTKAIEKLITADKEQSETMNNFLIALTKVSEAENRLASDVRDMQEQQRKNTEMIFNRK